MDTTALLPAGQPYGGVGAQPWAQGPEAGEMGGVAWTRAASRLAGEENKGDGRNHRTTAPSLAATKKVI